MTTITLPRAVLEQALEALEMCRLNGSQYLYGGERDLVFSSITTLRTALAQEQAEPVLQTCNCRWDGDVQVQQCTLHEAHVDAIHEWAERAKTAEKKLAALTQQAEPPGCDHCNHPLYAATRCRVCGRVTEQAESVQEPMQESALQAVAEKIGDQCAVWYGIGARDVEEVLREAARYGLVRAAQAEPVQEPIGYLWPTGRHPEFRFTQQKRDGVDGTPVYTVPPKAEPVQEPVARECSDPMCACRGGPCAECEEGQREREIEDLRFSLDFYQRRCEALQAWQCKMRDPERTIVCDILANGFTLDAAFAGDRYTAPPQRKPLTDEEINQAANNIFIDDPVQWWRKLARAVERAHGIGDNK